MALRICGTLLLTSMPLFATAGFAEWEIDTPGGNRISHADPFLPTRGTVVKAARADAIYIDHLEWWQYYPNALAGKSRNGFFVFNETTRAVSFYPSEAELNQAIAQRRLGSPSAARMTQQDGWRQVWMPILNERCKSTSGAGLDAATKAAMQSFCDQVKSAAQ